MGYNSMKVKFNMQGYMRNETFSTTFGLQVFPAVNEEESFGVTLKPRFQTTDAVTGEAIALSSNVAVGAGWEFSLL